MRFVIAFSLAAVLLLSGVVLRAFADALASHPYRRAGGGITSMRDGAEYEAWRDVSFILCLVGTSVLTASVHAGLRRREIPLEYRAA